MRQEHDALVPVYISNLSLLLHPRSVKTEVLFHHVYVFTVTRVHNPSISSVLTNAVGWP